MAESQFETHYSDYKIMWSDLDGIRPAFQKVMRQSYLFFLSCLLIFFSSLASAQSQVVELYRAYRAIPQDQMQLLTEIQNELTQGNADLFQALSKASKPEQIKAFLDALEHGEDPVVIERLARELNQNKMTYFRFVVQLNERMQQRPRAIERIESRLNRLQESLADKKIRFPNLGERFLNGSLNIAGMMSFAYSFSVSYMPAMSEKMEFAHGLFFIPAYFGMYLGMQIVQEYRAIKLGLKSYLREAKWILSTRKQVRDLKVLLLELKSSPEAKAAADSARYFGSDQADKDFRQLLPKILQHHQQNIDLLRASKGDWALLMAFSQSKQFFKIFRELNESLTESEKLLLKNQLQDSSAALSELLDIDKKVLSFEQLTLAAFEKYTQEDGHGASEELRKEVLLRKQELHTAQMDGTELVRPVVIGQIGQSISLALLGLYAAVGKDPDPFDHVFGVQAIDWIRIHHKLIFYSAGILCLPSITNFYYILGNLFRLKRIKISDKERILKAETMSRLVNLSAEKLLQQTSNIDSLVLPQPTSEDVIDQLTERPLNDIEDDVDFLQYRQKLEVSCKKVYSI